MPTRYFYSRPVFILSLLLGSSAGSVNLFILTPEGIVIAADGKSMIAPDCGTSDPVIHGTAMKILLLKHGLAVSEVGIESAKSRDHTTTLYDFPGWIKSEYHKLHSNGSISQLFRVIENEGPAAMAFVFTDALNLTCHFKENQPSGIGLPNILAQYIVAGYEAGVPAIDGVELDVNWKERTITRKRIPIQPIKRDDIYAGKGGIGYYEIIWTLCNHETDYYKRTLSKFPAETEVFCRGDLAHFTLQQASDMLRILIEIDSEVYPDHLGFPITVVTIPRVGRSRILSYCHPFPSDPDRLTRKSGCKEKHKD